MVSAVAAGSGCRAPGHCIHMRPMLCFAQPTDVALAGFSFSLNSLLHDVLVCRAGPVCNCRAFAAAPLSLVLLEA